MKVTATLKNLTDSFYTDLGTMQPREAYLYINRLKQDLPHCIKTKTGNGQFNDAVELNRLMRMPCNVHYKLEPRRGYKLVTFEFNKV